MDGYFLAVVVLREEIACQGADFSPFSADDDNNNHLQEWWQTGWGMGREFRWGCGGEGLE